MHNGICKIVKSWAFNQFLLKKQEARATLDRRRGYNTTWHRRIAVIIQKSPSTSRQIWSEVFDRAKGI